VAVPSLSQIHAWNTDLLEAAADHWEARAQTWQNAYDAVYREVPFPGGTLWEGRAAEAALMHAGSDRLRAVGAADTLHAAAAVARDGASQVSFAKQQAVTAVEAARGQGFEVAQDLSVIDRTSQPSALLRAHRQAQAESHAATIRTAATGLVAADEDVAGRITTAAAGLGNVQYAQNTVPSSPDDGIVDNRNSVQAVDFKHDGGPKPPPLPPAAGQPPNDFVGQWQQAITAPQAAPPPPTPTPTPQTPSTPVPPTMQAPPAAPLPGYPDLVKQVQEQQKQIEDLQRSANQVTVGGLGGAAAGGCAGAGVTAGILGAETGPIDGPIALGGCVLGGMGGLGSYLAGIWASNAFSGSW
jgi:hypothetical protein